MLPNGNNMGKVEVVARAICKAAGYENHPRKQCMYCENGECVYWKTFRDEARDAIRAMEEYEKRKILK